MNDHAGWNANGGCVACGSSNPREPCAMAPASFWKRKYEALVWQVQIEGCEVAHIGEYTYECNVQSPCGLCRLRQDRDKYRKLAEQSDETSKP